MFVGLVSGIAMTSERHQEIGRLYHAALEMHRDQRETFLGSACANDPDLYRQVIELLIAHDQAENSIETPCRPQKIKSDWALNEAVLTPQSVPVCIRDEDQRVSESLQYDSPSECNAV
jgi:hypothetical protein